jgi:hypothetical protein
MKHIPSFDEFLNEALDIQYVDQDDIRKARSIVTGLKAGNYELTTDVTAYVLYLKDQEQSNRWVGSANVPRVKLSKETLKKGTHLVVTPFGEEVLLNGNSENPIWLVNPTLFSGRRIKDSYYDDLRKIVDVTKRK